MAHPPLDAVYLGCQKLGRLKGACGKQDVSRRPGTGLLCDMMDTHFWNRLKVEPSESITSTVLEHGLHLGYPFHLLTEKDTKNCPNVFWLSCPFRVKA